ncbi:GntR family transcriptional regulator [Microbacteriaceae bacterium SG_E_30_P1]|uniref:GntR family transcriptional regulator n=1 Tax=Antiquaquibacter oligotrophicus TaxID=2880260 RepID=A0ABT6KQ87_9MICO|nr:GntR family transcriptional regulator [Antiquaquibacter oligotrophicus]MDH6182146.1 GntR family transcriptional regulator [Antiquaquibacter oligotrophicus]UDF12191.1 GntR family transcriptional regulator [Antiquaquibacter oligotrophicus]
MTIVEPSTVRADHPDPLWLQAADYIRGDIVDGTLVEGMRLPPERELCARLAISRVTLRKALLALVDDGVLTASHGRGWYVASAPGAPSRANTDWSNSLESFSETARRMGLVASSRILRCEVAPATLDEAEELLIAPGTDLFHLSRVRMLGSVPIAIDDSRVPAELAPRLRDADFTHASLYEQLTAAGLDLHRADSSIEALSADGHLASHLAIDIGKPVLVMHQIVKNSDERPIFTSDIRYAGERYRLRTSFARSQKADHQ